jgi:hypothetical protein
MSLVDDFHLWRDTPIRQRPSPKVRLFSDAVCPCGTPLAFRAGLRDKYCSPDCVPSGGIDYELTNEWRWRPEDLNEGHRTLVKVNGWDWGDGLTLSLLLPEDIDDTAGGVNAHVRLDDGVHYVGRNWGVAVELLSDPDALYLHVAEMAPRLLAELTRGAANSTPQPLEPRMLEMPGGAERDDDGSCECCVDDETDAVSFESWSDLVPTRVRRTQVRRQPLRRPPEARAYGLRLMHIPGGEIYTVLVDKGARQGFPLAKMLGDRFAPEPSYPTSYQPPAVICQMVVPESLWPFARSILNSRQTDGFYDEPIYRELQNWLARSPLRGPHWQVPAWMTEEMRPDRSVRLTIM